MTAKIYIARSDVFGLGEHSYFVFDPDGDPASGDEKIIRGGPVNGNGTGGYIIEADRNILDSRDFLDGDDPFDDRYYTTIASGTTFDMQNKWNDMVAAAKSFGNKINDPDSMNFPGEKVYVLPETGYFLFDPNCNTLTGSVADAGGIDIMSNLPKIDGDPGSGDRMPASQYVGITSRFNSTGNDSVTLDPDITAIFDQGGADIYTYDPTANPNFTGTFTIIEDTSSSTLDKIILQNVDPSDIRFERDGFGNLWVYIEGRNIPLIKIEGQFDDGIPKINTLWVEPSGGGTAVVTPLSNPDSFPLLTPSSPPYWIEGPKTSFGAAPDEATPLVIDLDSDGIELTAFSSLSTQTFFDIDGDGFAEQTAWVSGDDGLLVRDLDNNGTIDGVHELFGSASTDGFAILSMMDSNGDLRIDSNDIGWADLKIWKDSNEDAVTQDGELLTLASLNIVSIDLAGVVSSFSTINGNPISHTSTFLYGNGSSGAIADAWFVHDDVNTFFSGDYTLDIRTLFLPTLRGFGEVPDLHIAMSINADLLNLVQNFVFDWSFELFSEPAALDNKIADILYEWAGVTEISPNSRGNNVDAQHLEFLEKYFAQDFLQWGVSPNPRWQAGEVIEQAWNQVLDNIRAQLIVQAGGASLFDQTAVYNSMSGALEGDFDPFENTFCFVCSA